MYRENDEDSFVETSALKELNHRLILKRMKEPCQTASLFQYIPHSLLI